MQVIAYRPSVSVTHTLQTLAALCNLISHASIWLTAAQMELSSSLHCQSQWL